MEFKKNSVIWIFSFLGSQTISQKLNNPQSCSSKPNRPTKVQNTKIPATTQ